MKRQDLLTSTGLMSENLDRLCSQLGRHDLIEVDEIPDELAEKIICMMQKKTAPLYGKTPPFNGETLPFNGKCAKAQKNLKGDVNPLFQSQVLVNDQVELINDGNYQAGLAAGNALAENFARGLVQGYSDGLGKFTAVFMQNIVPTIPPLDCERLQQKYGVASLESTATKMRAMRQMVEEKTLPPSWLDV